jgi:hypothetical protein
MGNIELDYANGYYTVGNEIFEKKVLAVQRASTTKQDVEWVWHDKKMSSFDWTVEPPVSLDMLYKLRAQEIREKYDYVLIFCSGGADSTNVLQSFLKNGIHVDEVVAGAPLSGLSNWKYSNTDYSANNTISETKFAQLPLMEYVQQNFPKTKVTIHDYFTDMLNYKEDSWLINSGDYIHPTFAARYNLERHEYSYLRKLADSGKKIALVYGIDKPMLGQGEKNMYIVFSDQLVCNGFKSIEHPNVSVELFYWSPDAIPLLTKQGHTAAKWVCKPENEDWLENAVVTKTSNLVDAKWSRNAFERKIIPLVYPSLNYSQFQCQKPNRAFMGQHDAWFPVLHSDLKVRQLMISDYRNLTNSLDSSVFRTNGYGRVIGFRKYYKFYKLGPIEKFRGLI